MNALRHFAKLLAGLLVLVQLGMCCNVHAATSPTRDKGTIEVLSYQKTVADKTVHFRSAIKRLYLHQSLAFRLFQKLPNLVQTNIQFHTVFRLQQEIAQEHQAKRLKIFLHTRFQQASYQS